MGLMKVGSADRESRTTGGEKGTADDKCAQWPHDDELIIGASSKSSYGFVADKKAQTDMEKKTIAAVLRSAIFIVLAVPCAASSVDRTKKPSIFVDNRATQCFQLDLTEIHSAGNVYIGRFEVGRQLPPGDCGCESKMIEYRVDGLANGRIDKAIVRSRFPDKRRDEVTLLIVPDETADPHEHYLLRIECLKR